MSDAFVDEAYRRFPDVTEAADHPLGKIVQDNGPLRYAFVEGAHFAMRAAAATRESAGDGV